MTIAVRRRMPQLRSAILRRVAISLPNRAIVASPATSPAARDRFVTRKRPATAS